jgi:hypothetical protein
MKDSELNHNVEVTVRERNRVATSDDEERSWERSLCDRMVDQCPYRFQAFDLYARVVVSEVQQSSTGT